MRVSDSLVEKKKHRLDSVVPPLHLISLAAVRSASGRRPVAPTRSVSRRRAAASSTYGGSKT
jgi:hypothetical protein